MNTKNIQPKTGLTPPSRRDAFLPDVEPEARRYTPEPEARRYTPEPEARRYTRPSRSGGFTLVELLLVLTILAILAGIVLPKFSNVGLNARKTAVAADIANFKTALSMFEIDMGYFPKGSGGLNALVVRPSGVAANSKWHKYLDVDKLPKDPWNNDYVYENPGKHNPDGYDVYSKGPEGRGGADAIGNWTSTAP
jgi:general secretion pathway protein G